MKTLLFVTLAAVAGVVGLVWMIHGAGAVKAAEPVGTGDEGSAHMVRVTVIGKDGKLTGPVEVPKVELSDAEWQKRLTPEQYRILRKKGTEAAFCGGFLNNHEPGYYVCAGCGLPLFDSATKFESGTGWPSFYRPIVGENVKEVEDRSYGMVRTETKCARCGGHLGHVFEDGPKPTGLRYCMNSESLKFVPLEKLASAGEDVPGAAGATTRAATTGPSTRAAAVGVSPVRADGYAETVFAGGCFWCVEAVFEQLDGVKDAVSGYAGGDASTANYEAVCTGTTGHAESVKVIYDPAKVSYEKLLEVHFATHDPTTLNRQGNDRGTQYRSAIFYANEKEKAAAEAFIAHLQSSGKYGDRKIVTTLEPLTGFYEAELYHQNFVCNNPNQGYVRAVAAPKVEKTREKFPEMLKGK